MRSLYCVLGLAACGAVLTVASGCGRPSQAETHIAAGESQSPAAAVERVTAGTPQRQSLRLVTFQPGRIEAFEQTPLYPKLTGYVKEILVDIGDPVDKDQVLVRLWVPEMQDELRQKQALVAQAEAEVQQADAAIRAAEAARKTAEAQVRQAEAGVMRADAEHQRWKGEHRRISELAERGSVTGKLVDEALNQFRASEAAQQEAAARVEAVEAAIHEAEAHVEKARADAGAARARLKVAQANLARTQTMVAYTEIKAPFDGVVTARHVDTRHYVQPPSGGNPKPLLVVARTDRVRIFVDVPETEAALVDRGDPATVRVQALHGPEIHGTVTRTGWALHAANRSLRTEIDLDNADGRLRPGMYVTAEIGLDARQDALTVPATAIVREGDETFVCCAQSGRIARTPVTLGLRSGDRIEVLDGLDGGELVVLTRADALQDRQPVEVIRPEAP